MNTLAIVLIAAVCLAAAYLLDGRCQKITGGSLEQVNGSLYVLRATAPEVTVVLAS